MAGRQLPAQFAPAWMAGRPPSRLALHQLRVVIVKVVAAVFCCCCCCCHQQTTGQGKGIIGLEIRSSGSNFHLEMRDLRNQHVSLFMCGSFLSETTHWVDKQVAYIHACTHAHTKTERIHMCMHTYAHMYAFL